MCVWVCDDMLINEIHNYSMNIQLNDIKTISESSCHGKVYSGNGKNFCKVNCKDKKYVFIYIMSNLR